MKFGTLLASAIAVAVSTAAMAASKPGVSVSADKRTVIAGAHPGHAGTPHFVHPPKAKVIAGNLATAYPDGLYFAGEGYTLCGSTCALDESISAAIPFTPSANATAADVQVSVGYIEGTNEYDVAIYSDASGVPGTALWSGKVTNGQDFGDCCAVSLTKIKPALALTGGTQYWVVVSADPKATDFFGAWPLSTTDQVDSQTFAENVNGGGWEAYSSTLVPAFEVDAK
jgi:hypothetical protein